METTERSKTGSTRISTYSGWAVPDVELCPSMNPSAYRRLTLSETKRVKAYASLRPHSDSTREKFVQVYHFPESIAQHTTSSRIGTASHSTHGHSASLQGSSAFLNPKGGTSPNQRSGKDSARSSHAEPAPTLQTTVLNLIKIVQSALSLFGLFDIAEEERDGLLCDTTVDGIRKCIDVIGKFVDVEVRIRPSPAKNCERD